MQLSYIHVEFEAHRVDIPYFEINGRFPGPHIFLSAGMHGGEINGIAVIESFLEWSQKEGIAEKLHGKISVLPLMNPSGFANKQRRVYEDKGDLNRAFGAETPANFSEQHIIKNKSSINLYVNKQHEDDSTHTG